MSTTNRSVSPRRRVARVRERVARRQTRSRAEVIATHDTLRVQRDALAEQARALSWNGAPHEWRAVRQLVAHAISIAALEAAAAALEEARPIILAPDGARIRALSALAGHAGRSIRAGLEKQIVDIAQRRPDMEDTEAWVCAARLARGRARASFAIAAVTMAGRSQSARACIAALAVAPEPAADKLARAAAASLAATFASMELGVVSS